ncbi:MAG TPA: type II secretion system protein [Candidatus Paceibacterota bacterium]
MTKAPSANIIAPSKGFTLIESLVYIALLVILFVGIVQAVAMLSSSYRSVRTVRSVESSATQAIDRMAREIRNADEVNAAQTVFDNNPGSLSLLTSDDEGNESTLRFHVSGGRLMLEENGSSLGPVTAADVVVTSLVFRSFATTTSAAVKIELNLSSASTSPYVVNEKFYGTAVLRGSY